MILGRVQQAVDDRHGFLFASRFPGTDLLMIWDWYLHRLKRELPTADILSNVSLAAEGAVHFAIWPSTAIPGSVEGLATPASWSGPAAGPGRARSTHAGFLGKIASAEV